MIVIAYTKGVIAADTKAVDEDGLSLKSQKLFTLPNKTVIGTAGDADVRGVLTLLGKATLSKMPSKASLAKTECTSHGVWVFPTGEVFKVKIDAKEAPLTGYLAEILPILDQWVTVGSGGPYALGAMLAGKSAIEAVRIACKLDNNCGIPIESIKIH